MSFALEVKQEIGLNELKPCCMKAQLSALTLVCATLSIVNKQMTLVYKSENPTTSKRILKLVKGLFEVETQLSIIHKMNLKKNNIYQIKVSGNVLEILETLGLKSSKGLLDCPLRSIVTKECCARAYLAGAFLASGSINNPVKSNYHLEIKANNEHHAKYIMDLLERFYIPSKVTMRRNYPIVYIKTAEKIGDFIRLVGASESLLKFEDIRIQRDFKNNLTRLDNCEIANEMKTQKAANAQLEMIQSLINQGLYSQCDTKMREVIDLRLKYPDASLSELCDYYYQDYGQEISKSGLKHRFNKIASLEKKG